MKFYVYELVDPRDDSVFYVGKSSVGNSRLAQHRRDARHGYGTKKNERIREIESQGYKVVRRKIAHFYDQQDAFEFEKERIAHYGMHNLTNMTPGGQVNGYGHIWPTEVLHASEHVQFAWPYMDRHGRI